MKNILLDIDSEQIWDAVFSLQQGENVDLTSFSFREKQEIDEFLKIIQSIKSSQDGLPTPSKEGFASMMEFLSTELYTTKKGGSWGNFLKIRFPKQWALVPVFAVLIATIPLWTQKNEVKVAAAEMLSAEIEKDLQDMHKEIEEVDLLKKDFNIVYNQSKSIIPYF
jgi:hypothetical protein